MGYRFGNRYFTVCALGIGFLAVGMFSLWHGVGVYVNAKRAEAWPAVQGQVVQSQLIDQSARNSEARIEYTYVVDGAAYRSDHVDFSATSGSAWARSTVNAFPEGKTVIVHYNPSNPAQAVIRTQIGRGFLVMAGLGTVFVALGTSVLRLRKEFV